MRCRIMRSSRPRSFATTSARRASGSTPTRRRAITQALTFENAIATFPVTADRLARPGPRKLLFYARPEQHAARNLFELGILALRSRRRRGSLRRREMAPRGDRHRPGLRAGSPRRVASSVAPAARHPRRVSNAPARLRRGSEPHADAPPEPGAARDGGGRSRDRHQHLRQQDRGRAPRAVVEPDASRTDRRGDRARL